MYRTWESPTLQNCLFNHPLRIFFFFFPLCSLLFLVQNLTLRTGDDGGAAANQFKVRLRAWRIKQYGDRPSAASGEAEGSGLLIMGFLCGDSLLAG